MSELTDALRIIGTRIVPITDMQLKGAPISLIFPDKHNLGLKRMQILIDALHVDQLLDIKAVMIESYSEYRVELDPNKKYIDSCIADVIGEGPENQFEKENPLIKYGRETKTPIFGYEGDEFAWKEQDIMDNNAFKILIKSVRRNSEGLDRGDPSSWEIVLNEYIANVEPLIGQLSFSDEFPTVDQMRAEGFEIMKKWVEVKKKHSYRLMDDRSVGAVNRIGDIYRDGFKTIAVIAGNSHIEKMVEELKKTDGTYLVLDSLGLRRGK